MTHLIVNFHSSTLNQVYTQLKKRKIAVNWLRCTSAKSDIPHTHSGQQYDSTQPTSKQQKLCTKHEATFTLTSTSSSFCLWAVNCNVTIVKIETYKLYPQSLVWIQHFLTPEQCVFIGNLQWMLCRQYLPLTH